MTDHTETLTSLITRLEDEYGTGTSTVFTEKLFDVIMESDRDTAMSCLFPILLDAVRNHRRSNTRTVEQAVDGEIRQGVDPSTARKKFVNEFFWIKKVGFVSWLEGTADQHLERAADQRARAGPLIVDALRHEAAAKDINVHGVRCLADLAESAERKAA